MKERGAAFEIPETNRGNSKMRVPGTFQDEREFVWLREGEKEGSQEKRTTLGSVASVMEVTGEFYRSDKADLHFKRLTLARDDGDLN